ncbi:MAG: hypothetical protein P8Y10_07415 [Gemmatimonadales bacterium]
MREVRALILGKLVVVQALLEQAPVEIAARAAVLAIQGHAMLRRGLCHVLGAHLSQLGAPGQKLFDLVEGGGALAAE